jgi:ubiquinone/menaquinone biosynthesis C-methylase UbiE
MRCLYVAPSGELRVVDDGRLDQTSERHKLELTPSPYAWQGTPIAALDRDSGFGGLVLEMYLGWVGRDRIAVAAAALQRGRRVWIYWPSERVVECVDRERLASHRRHWLFITASRHTAGIGEARARAPMPRISQLDSLLADAAPVAFPATSVPADPRRAIDGVGVYLRLGFWRPGAADGVGASAVVNELAAVTESLVCFVSHRIDTLERSELRQVVLDPPPVTGSENQLAVATPHYSQILRPAIEALRPHYIYERLCLGNHAGALLSRSLEIPYIVEYGGSEIATRLTSDGGRFMYDDEYLKAEALAFKQATIVSVTSVELMADLVRRGVDEAKILVNAHGIDSTRVRAFLAGDRVAGREAATADVQQHVPRHQIGDDAYKDETRRQWDNDPAGSQHAAGAQPHTLDWFLEVEAHRYGVYAPWMPGTMEFNRHAGRRVLELGGGMGTDLAQFARHGSIVTDLDLSSGHLELAKENFRLRGLTGEFLLHDMERLPFEDNRFDVVYSNGVLHHTPNTRLAVDEIHRVLKPGGRVIVMVYAENSLHYWRNLVGQIGLKEEQLLVHSMGEIMSRAVERSDNAAARPLVKAYTRARLRKLFRIFENVEIVQRQMVEVEKPKLLAAISIETLGRWMGWNLIVKAVKQHP